MKIATRYSVSEEQIKGFSTFIEGGNEMIQKFQTKSELVPPILRKYLNAYYVKLYNEDTGELFDDIEYHQTIPRHGYASLTEKVSKFKEQFVQYIGQKRAKDPMYFRTLGHFLQAMRIECHYNRMAKSILPIWTSVPIGRMSEHDKLRKYIGTARTIETVFSFLQDSNYITTRIGSEVSSLTSRFQTTERFRKLDEIYRDNNEETTMFRFHRLDSTKSIFYIQDRLFSNTGEPHDMSLSERCKLLSIIEQDEKSSYPSIPAAPHTIPLFNKKDLTDNTVYDTSIKINDIINNHTFQLSNITDHTSLELEYLCSNIALDPQEIHFTDSNIAELPVDSLFTVRHLKKRTKSYECLPEEFKPFCSKEHTYGRLHSKCQSIKKSLRGNLLIDNESTHEVDVSGSHLSILYALARKKINEDKYDINSPTIVVNKKLPIIPNGRAIGKEAFVRALNAATKTEAIRSINFYLLKSQEFKPCWALNIKAEQILERLEALNPDVKHFFYRDLGLDVMYIESMISKRIVESLAVQDIPTLHIHDSWVVKKSNKRDLLLAMQQAFKDVLDWNQIYIKDVCPMNNRSLKLSITEAVSAHDFMSKIKKQQNFSHHNPDTVRGQEARSLKESLIPVHSIGRTHDKVSGLMQNKMVSSEDRERQEAIERLSEKLIDAPWWTRPILQDKLLRISDNNSYLSLSMESMDDRMMKSFIEGVSEDCQSRVAGLAKALMVEPIKIVDYIRFRRMHCNQTEEESVYRIEIVYSDFGYSEAMKLINLDDELV